MAPLGSGKRKRGDRSWSGESFHDGQRPSPHRPETLHLAQQNGPQSSTYGHEQLESRGRGGRQSSRIIRGHTQTRSSASNTKADTSATATFPPQVQKMTDPKPGPQTNGLQSGSRKSGTAPPAKKEAEPVFDNDPHPRPFGYSWITDEICNDWQTTGRDSLLERGLQLRDSRDKLGLGSLFQELLWAGVLGRLTPSAAGELVKEITWAGNDAYGAEGLAAVDVPSNVSECQRILSDNICVIVSERSQVPRGMAAVIQNSAIPLSLLRQELDIKLVGKFGLVRTNFSQMAVRKTTNLLYRQANFNLLREETEGFAKLVTELFTTSGNEPPTAEVVEETVERVKALIGSFDLGVGRALDVVLDVFGAVLVKQFRFFVKFLRASPWWPGGENRPAWNSPTGCGGLPQWALPGFTSWVLDNSQKSDLIRRTEEHDRSFWARARDVGVQAFYELGRQRVKDGMTPTEPFLAAKDGGESSPREDFIRDWIKQTGTMPPGGNEDAAQLLGFKLRFYSSSAARTENDTLPDNLIYLSALLIKVGFISLKDLYAHIWRTDDDMEALRQEKVKEKSERERAARPGQGARNALLMAGALPDDTLPAPARVRDTGTRVGTPSKEAEVDKTVPSDGKKDALPEPADQKVPLLKSLLAIGALPESLFILGKFPWIVDVYPELPEYINRIFHHALSKVYSSVRPLGSSSKLQLQKPSIDSDIAGMPKSHLKLTPTPPRKVLRWALLDKDDSGTDGLDYRFYWDEWSDNIPVCQTVDDVFTLCDTLVNLTGIKIGQDPTLLVKIARIGKHSIEEDRSEYNFQRWIDLCKRILVPALSLTKSNPGVVSEVYELLSNFTIETRYLIYQEWSCGRISKSPAMKPAADQAKAETRDTLKRLSKTNVRPMARALAKIAYSNPHIVINTAISQIEAYDNLAEVFVEGARYFTDLGYDVLTWSLISALGRAGRSRVQESGLVTSRWLTALAYFAGKMFKRYAIMRPAPVLQYVTDQLLKGNPTDLIVLEQIILFMAGIVADASYNDAQLLAMGGGELLRSQTILQLLDRRHESKVTSRRLMRSLKESDLAGKLLLAIATQRQTSVFNLDDTDAPLKLLGNLYDEIHRVSTQYLDLLQSNLSPEEFESAVPDVCDLIVTYKVQPEIAFWISRPTLARRIADFDKASHLNGEKRKTEEAVAKDVGNGDMDMADQVDGAGEDEGEALETEPVTESAATPTPAEINGVVSNPDSPAKAAGEEGSHKGVENQHWHPVLQPIMTSIQTSLATDVSTVMGLGFYVTFWQLALYDVAIPGKSYEDELSRQHKRMAAISSNRADVTAAGARKREAEKKQISSLIDRLLKENKDHLKAFGDSKARLSREKDQWFTGMHGKAEQLNSALIEHCFLPRILLSPLDAVFCFKFLKFLHTSGTSNFRTMGFYDLLFRQNRLTALIFMCTSREADNLGRFLNEILRDLVRWQRDKTVYEREAWGSKKTLPGFAKKVGTNGKPETFLHYEDFRRLLFKWHQLLFTALQTCLSSTEYMHIRNAISVLKAVAENFPAINFHGNQLQKLVSGLGQSDQGDIKVPSLALMADLNKAEKSWILPQAFRKGQEKTNEGFESAPKASTPDTAGKPLNAAAADFKPSISSSGDESSAQQPPIDSAKTQDKEVEDSKSKDAGSTDGGPSDEALRTTAEQEMISNQQPEIASEAKPHMAANDQDSKTADSATSLSIQETRSDILPLAGDSTTATVQPGNVLSRPEPAASPQPAHGELPPRPEHPEFQYMRPGNAHIPDKPAPHADNSRGRRDTRRQGFAPPARYGEGPRESGDQRPVPGPNQERISDLNQPGRDLGEDGLGLQVETSTRYLPPERGNRAPPRENGASDWEPGRSDRSRPPSGSPRTRFQQERLRQEVGGQISHMAPPRVPHPVNTDVPSINPERAALIDGGPNDRNGISIRGQGEDRTPQRSRAGSPQRDSESRSTSRQDRREERTAVFDRRTPNFAPRSRDRNDASTTGSGSRDQYLDRPIRPGDSYSRDLRHQQSPQLYAIDATHGRLSQDDHPSSRHHKPASDHPEAFPDIPSGPRSRNQASASHGPRTISSQYPNHPPRLSSGSGQPPLGAPDRSNPSGPGSRPRARSQSFQEQQVVSGSPPDTSGVHPDRLALVSPSAEGPPPRLPVYSSIPPSIQTAPPSVPSGPRGNAPSGAPSGPAPVSRGPPSGPQGNGRNNRHPLAAVNNTLQQAGQGQSMRGRGATRVISGASVPVGGTSNPGPSTVPGPRSEVSLPPSRDYGRAELFPARSDLDSNGRDLPPQLSRLDPQSERSLPRGRRGELMNESREGRRTSSRHSDVNRAHSAERDSPGRQIERGYGGRPSHDHDNESYRNERGTNGRDSGRGRDGDGGREDRRHGDGPGRDRRAREELSHRRDEHPAPLPPSAPSRSGRRDGAGGDLASSSVPASSSTGPSQVVPSPSVPPHSYRDERGGRRRGYPSGPASSRGPDESDYHRNAGGNERHLRDRRPPPQAPGRDARDSRDSRGGLPTGEVDDPPHRLPPRKHPRADDPPAYGGAGGGRGGNRMASESKRPRRGGG